MKKILILFFVCTLAVTAAYSQTQDDVYYNGDQSTVAVQAPEPPPPMPQYQQPPCPEEGYLWNPGYWAWATNGYYWVPGVWVLPPQPGLLWTPGYWGFYGGYYGWHRGYWGAEVGWYGGINYGYGYWGHGFYGGRWEGGHFLYNSAIWHVDNRYVHNVYVDRTVIRNNVVNRASFNGPRGVTERPAGREEAVMHATTHTQKTQEQASHEQTFAGERGQFARTNKAPAVHSMNRTTGQRFNAKGRPAAPSRSAPSGGGKRR